MVRLFLLAFLLSGTLLAQSPITYEVKLEDIAHHELHVTITFPAVPQGALYVRMPQSSPGRYALHSFAKNVYDVQAMDGRSNPLSVVKTQPSEWQINGHDGQVRLQYTLYGNRAGGTYSGFNNHMAHMNMPATFIYGVGFEERPIEIHFDLGSYPGWKVATQLEQLDEDSFAAPDYYYFYDSPTIIGDIDFRDWQVASGGKTYTIEVAMLHEGTDEELNDYVEWMKKIVDTQKDIYGTLPDFDFGKYTFLCSYNPWVAGDGMEHRNSTVCTAPANLENYASRLIGTISHEFFHCWNVERIRPKSLEPFDFDRPDMSGELWFAEGFTSYYDDLTLCRAGIITPEEYAEGLAGTLNYVLNAPGRNHRNPIEMSKHAPFVDAATSIDEDNHDNTFVSYYSYGAVLGLSLDLLLRTEFERVTLDDVMRYLWTHYGQPEVPYEIPDLQQAIAEVTGDADFAATFFQKYIYDSELPDLEALLGKMGIILQLQNPEQSWLTAVRFEYQEDGALIRGGLFETHPLYLAGLNNGDKVLSINGQPLTDAAALKKVLENTRIGKSYPIRYRQNGVTYESTFKSMQNPALETLLFEQTDRKVDATTAERRAAWLE